MLIPDYSLPCLPNLVEDFSLERIVPQKAPEIIDLPAVDYYDRVSRLIFFIDWHLGDFLDNLHAIDDLPEDYVFAIEVRAGFEGDEELRGIGVPAAVGHR